MKKLRLFFVPGCWQLVMAVAAMRSDHELWRKDKKYSFSNQHEITTDRDEWEFKEKKWADDVESCDVLCLYAVPDTVPMKAMLPEMAKKLHHWHSIIWTNDELRGASHDWQQSARKLREKLSESVTELPDELWLCKIQERGEKMLLACWPDAKVVLYEAGLENYIDHPVTCGVRRLSELSVQRWPGWLKREISHFRKNRCECTSLPGWCRRDISRVRAAYYVLSDKLPVSSLFSSKIRTISTHELRRVISQLSKLSSNPNSFLPPRQESSDSVWVVGQGFSMSGEMSYDDEINMYVNAIQILTNYGYAIEWIDHPRTARPLAPVLAQCFKGLAILETKGYPLECFVEAHKPRMAVSCFSSALFYFQLLYRIPVGVIKREPFEWKIPVFRRLAHLASMYLPEMSALMRD